MRYRFLVVTERTKTGYSAYIPDLPGCIATGKTHDIVAKNIHEAIDFHIQGMLEDGIEIPKNVTFADYMVV